jgi:hypothetical protein
MTRPSGVVRLTATWHGQKTKRLENGCCRPATMILAQIPKHIQLIFTVDFHSSYQIDNGLAGLEQFMFIVELL